jgi:hypothetical protein
MYLSLVLILLILSLERRTMPALIAQAPLASIYAAVEAGILAV